MKRGILKTVMATAIGAVLALQGMSFAAYTTLYESRSEVEHYADGVTHETIQRFTDGGWLNVHVMRIDLDANVDMTVLTDELLSKRDTLTNLVQKNDAEGSIVAAINSDFFDTKNNTTLGDLIKDGRLLSTSVGYDTFASFNISNLGAPYVAYIPSPTNTLSNGTTTLPISYINKPYLAYDRTIVYDSRFAPYSYGNTGGVDLLEILVEDGVIKELRQNGSPFKIPENGYVVAGVGTHIQALRDAFKVGDRLDISYDVNYRYTQLSIGGGAQLVKDGVALPEFSQNILGRHPRTALGISKDRKHLMFVTVDGRTASYRGIQQSELAALMVELGAYEALNLDGGGSTQMVATSPWTGKVHTLNRPSDGSERRMYTALAVKKRRSDAPVLAEIRIQSSGTVLLKDTPMAFTLSAMDSNYTALPVDDTQVKWSVSGIQGTFDGAVLTPASAGKGVVTAEYGGKVARLPITIRAEAVRIVAWPTRFQLAENARQPFYLKAETALGEYIAVPLSAATVNVPPEIGTMDGDAFVAAATQGQGYISLSHQGLSTYIPVGVGTRQVAICDFEMPAAQFSSHPADVTGSYAELQSPERVGKSGMLQYDFTTSTATRAAYANFLAPRVLPAGTKWIKMDVFGDVGNGHWLRGTVQDAKGNSVNITFAQNVDWTGWKTVTAELPSGLSGPVQLNRIYLVETQAEKQDSGYIFMDNIIAVAAPDSVVVTPVDVTRETPVSSYKRQGAVDFSVMYYADAKKAEAAGAGKGNVLTRKAEYTQVDAGNAWVLTLNNAGRSIRANDPNQWIHFLRFAESYQGGKPVIVVMNDVYLFKDALEEALFFEQLEKIGSKGKDVAVVFATANAEFMCKPIEGGYLIKVPNSDGGARTLTFSTAGNRLTFEMK